MLRQIAHGWDVLWRGGDMAEKREIIRTAVTAHPACPYTNLPLDRRNTVVVELSGSEGGSALCVMHTSEWAAYRDSVLKFAVNIPGQRVFVHHGSHLFPKRRWPWNRRRKRN